MEKIQSQSYQSLLNKVSATRAKETALQLLSGILTSAGITLLAVLLATMIEFFASGDTAFRTCVAVVTLVIFHVSMIVFIVPPILRAFGVRGLPSINDVSLRVGKYYPEIKDKLGNAIQLISNADKNIGSSSSLITAEVDSVYGIAKDKNFDVIINKRRNYYLILFFVASLLLTITTFGVSEGMGEAFFRLRNFTQSFIPPAPFTIKLETPEMTLLRGAKAEIIFSATGQAPDYILLKIKEETQNDFDEYKLKKDKDGMYKYEIATVKQNCTFYGEATWITSAIVTEIGNIKVIDRPFIRSLSGTLHFPAYAHLQPKDIDEQSADIAALSGSSANLSISTNKPLKNAYIVFEKTTIQIEDTSKNKADTFHIPLKVSDNKASGTLRINQNGYYYFVVEDFDGETNINPIKYSVVALSDGSPTITLLYPTNDVQVTTQALLPMKVAISDDYGFTSLKLYYRLASSKFALPETNYKAINIPLTTTDLLAEIAYVWNLNKINIIPEDVYEFYLEVADNDLSNGPKKAQTQPLKVRLPSLAEVAKEADVSQNQMTNQLENIRKDAEQVKKDIEELQRDLLKNNKNKELDWKQQKQMKDIMEKQEQLQNQMQQMSQQVEETTQQLQQNNMLSQETMQKYQELQKLMQQVKSPQLDQMRKMQESQLQKMTPEELRKAMEQAKFDEEQFKQGIERTMEVLKRMQAEQKTDALTKRAEELKKKQDEINKEMQNTTDKNKLNELAQKQQQLKDELQNLSKDMKSLESLMKEIGEDMPLQEMMDAMNALDNQDISGDMDNSSEKMEKGDKSSADKSQKQASKKLDDFAKKMQKMKQEMQDKNSKEVMRKMQKAIENMVKISKHQEQTKNFTGRSDKNSTRVPDIANEQADIFENLYNVANELNDIGGKSFAITPEMADAINDAMRQMRKTMEHLTERQMQNAKQAQTTAMKDINSALVQMKDALEQMKSESDCDNGDGSSNKSGGKSKKPGKGGSGGGAAGGMGMGSSMQMQMQQMAAQQQAINQQMQEMMGQGGEGGMSQEQRAAMQRLSNEQDQMRKSMEELSKEQKDLGTKPEDREEQRKLANELQKMAEEMKEITADINRGNISPETLKRQEKILSRMLDATKSVNDRDFEKKRESNSGKDMQLKSPSGIDLSTQEGKMRAMQELMQSIKKGYTKDYEQVIRQYFEAIQQHY
ncbi:MAG: hypothetical protein LBO69_07950 [Ignavibacteria bacterium]|jgi:methyl-accepting chemotaxis protein|nr:hypothetical protein [Ignavibacteria bacterium]